jgi:hypothetical protein
MGQPDLYPFILTPAIVAKIGFIHGICGVAPHQDQRRDDRYAAHVLPAQPAMS